MLSKKSSRMKFIFVVCGFILMVGFQNCSQKKPEKKSDAASPSAATPPSAIGSEVPTVTDCTNNPSAAECLPPTCQFDTQVLNAGEAVQAFQNSSVPYGSSCVSESRLCTNAALTGSYAYSACQVSAPSSCLFNSNTIEHGTKALAFQNSTVSYGSTCISELRECDNGSLSGSYAFANCVVATPSSCLFNGQSIGNDNSVAAFYSSTVPFGSSCQQESRVCSNGVLSGQFEFASCNVEAPQSCLFNGQTIAHGQEVVSFQSSSVAYGNQCAQQIRVCDNGILSGTYEYASCNAQAPASCLFNGQTIANGQNVQAFENSSVAYGTTCQQETRTCSNGIMSGSFEFGTCSVNSPLSCNFNGQSVASGSSITAFQSQSASPGGSCMSESRICENGNLSGTYQYSDCTGAPTPTDSCDFGGQLVLNGASVTAYQNSSVPYGGTCVSESRTCTNGILSGTYTNTNCAIILPASCNFNGQTVLHGSSVTAYKTSAPDHKGNCSSQTRTCSNGSLSGGFKYSSCE